MKTRIIISALALASAFTLTACHDGYTIRNDSTATAPMVTIDASSREIVSGETVTLTARTKDTYGRDAQIKWTATSGSLKTEQEGRIARVKFDQPGTYSVRASLWVDGREIQSDIVEVRVRPVG